LSKHGNVHSYKFREGGHAQRRKVVNLKRREVVNLGGISRESLEQRNIFDSPTLCQLILKVTGVAMLPGKDFAPAGNELTARITYVDFNGKQVLNASMEIGIENELSESFIREFCPRMVEAFDRLGNWFSKLE